MGIISDRWKNNKYHVGDGIYFPDDTVIPILTGEHGKYYVGKRETLVEAIQRYKEDDEDEDWADFYYTGNTNHKNYQLKFGGGDQESEGIIILEHDHVLRWIIHFNDSEEFINANFDGNMIIAVAEYYPHKNLFNIPMVHPEEFTCEKSYEL